MACRRWTSGPYRNPPATLSGFEPERVVGGFATPVPRACVAGRWPASAGAVDDVAVSCRRNAAMDRLRPRRDKRLQGPYVV